MICIYVFFDRILRAAPAGRRQLIVALLCLVAFACGQRSIPTGGGTSSVVEPGVGHRFLSSVHETAVAEWVSANGDTLHLRDDHRGAFNGRRCSWEEIDESRVWTECEAPLRDDWIRNFTLSREGERWVGRLEYTEGVYRRID